jgi:hypothetical protein
MPSGFAACRVAPFVALFVVGCAKAQPLPGEISSPTLEDAGVVSSGGSTSAGALETGGNSGTGGTSPSSSGGSRATGGNGGAKANDAGPGVTVFSDDFESGLGAWTPNPTDGWSIATDGTNVYQQGTLDTEARVSSAGDSTWKDASVEARVKVLAFDGSSSSYFAAVCARFADADDYYYVALQGDGHVKIKKKSAGSNTSISSQATVTVEPNTWYTVKLVVVGASLTAYLDGAEVLTATDSDISAGSIAVATKNATAEFDDVVVRTQ